MNRYAIFRTIYFDNNATTRVDPRIAQKMLAIQHEVWGNPSSIHHVGQQSHRLLDKARMLIADELGAYPEEIYFTAGGTESDNLAIKGFLAANPDKGKHIITSAVEHHAVLHTFKYLERLGYQATFLPVDPTGMVDPDTLRRAIRPDTALISIMHANNEVGTINPLAELAAIANEHGIFFHTDAVQSFAKTRINVHELGLDALAASGHKIYGPKGVGILYLRKGIAIEPLFHGGHHERDLRAGTENLAGIVGLAEAVNLCATEREYEEAKLRYLTTRLWSRISTELPGVSLNGSLENRMPGTLNVSFNNVEGESIILRLDLHAICVSSGSACTSGAVEPSHVLTAMGVPAQKAQASIRFSLGRFNTQDEVDFVIAELLDAIPRLRGMSPLPMID